MARTLKPRYVNIYGITPCVTERGMAITAKDEDGRDFYVLASPKMLLALAKRIVSLTAQDWFRRKYNESPDRVAGVPATLSDPVRSGQ